MTQQSLSLATVLEKNKLSSDTPFLVLLDIEIRDPATGMIAEDPIKVVLNHEPVVFNGSTYENAIFDISFQQTSGELPRISLTFNDFATALRPRLEQYDGGIGSNVTMRIVNAGELDKPATIVEYFLVVGASAADYKVVFELGAENDVIKTFPRRRQTRDYCQWRFKDANCGYSGSATSCDLTLQGPNGCAAKGGTQTIRFGGFPGIKANGYKYV